MFIRSAEAAWAFVAVFWVLTSLERASIEARERAGRRLVPTLLLVASAWLMFGTDTAAQTTAFLPALGLAGLGLTYVGCAWAVWSKAILGGNWTARAAIGREHSLVARGPYAVTRHPIYGGLFAAAVGTALVADTPAAGLAVPLVFLAFALKAAQEERLMAEHFGAPYAAYRQTVTWRMVPFVY